MVNNKLNRKTISSSIVKNVISGNSPMMMNPVLLKFYLICVAVILVIVIGIIVWFIVDMNNTAEAYKDLAYSIGGTNNKSKDQFMSEWTQSKDFINDSITVDYSVNVNTKGDGKLITDAAINPYKLPLYDGYTMDASKLGCNTWTVPYRDNPFDIIKRLSKGGKYIISQENRRVEGGSQTWNVYDEINYSPESKPGELLPYTELDGRISIAVPWRWSVNPDTYPLDKDAGWVSASNVGMKGDVVQAGQYYDVVFSDGTVLAAIGGSAKGTESETNKTYQGYQHYDKSILEIVQYTDLPQGKPWSLGYDYGVEMGNKSGCPMNSLGPAWTKVIGRGLDIVEVVVYDMKYYTHAQGHINWFTSTN